MDQASSVDILDGKVQMFSSTRGWMQSGIYQCNSGFSQVRVLVLAESLKSLGQREEKKKVEIFSRRDFQSF